ncbi:unnamed protein product [Urochloa decumbens]|uniref:F-box protein n=1 Tax=Urochloa decumbens TaxID=240449 RepID=A0ABC8VE27_9POAL
MEAILQSTSHGGGAALLPATLRRPRTGKKNRLLCARASVRGAGVRQLAVTIDDLRLVRDAAAVAAAPPAEGGTAAVEKLRAVAEAAADRAEMHDIIGRQRDNWNHLLLHSTNSLTLAASAMAALAPAAPATAAALTSSAGVLLATAAVTMAAANKIQPSQLAEEQRNATRLWRQLERSLRAALDPRTPAATIITDADVDAAMDRVLALDAAYPLPLLPGMLEKFPKTLEPARWWPTKRQQHLKSKPAIINGGGARRSSTGGGNGWTPELEEEMRGVVRVIRAKDEQEYVKAGNKVLAVNRVLAVAGPALAGAGAAAAAFAGVSGDSWASGAAVVCGAMAAAANTVEHGWQLGMLFELCRNVAGQYRKVQEDIEACLDEADVERRENGEVFEAKVALLLGRRASEMKQFREMASPAVEDEDIKDFAGKLF